MMNIRVSQRGCDTIVNLQQWRKRPLLTMLFSTTTKKNHRDNGDEIRWTAKFSREMRKVIQGRSVPQLSTVKIDRTTRHGDWRYKQGVEVLLQTYMVISSQCLEQFQDHYPSGYVIASP